MKKLLALSLVLCFTLFTANVFAAEEATVYINGEELVCDVAPIVENGRTLVPLRAIFEAFGAQVAWDDEMQTALASLDGTHIILQIDTATAFINSEPHTLDVPARLYNDRTLVPARFVAEALGATVDWDEETSSVLITK